MKKKRKRNRGTSIAQKRCQGRMKKAAAAWRKLSSAERKKRSYNRFVKTYLKK